MGRMKDLYIEEVERKMSEYIDAGYDEQDAYDKASDTAYHSLGDRLADMADAEKQRLKDEGKWPPRKPV